MDIPSAVQREAGIEPTGIVLPARVSPAWLVRRGDQLAVLRRLDRHRWPVDDGDACDDVVWLHEYLAQLTGTAFPAPEPLPFATGRSWTVHDGAFWELMTFLPGQVVGWRAEPTLTDIGKLLARFHNASTTITPTRQRPRAFALEQIVSLPATGPLGQWLQNLAHDLQRIGHHDRQRLVIHGDFTAHNVLASGYPLRPTGVIDFELAYRETACADLGFGLWRTGRAHQEAIGLDPKRVHDMVSGYASVRPLPPDAADAITVYIRARGIQQAVKALTRGSPADDVRAQRIRWLTMHHGELCAAIADAIEP